MCFFVLFLLLFIPDPSPTHLFLLLFLFFFWFGGRGTLVNRYLFLIAGHVWGDPCEFGFLSVLNTVWSRHPAEKYGPHHAQEARLGQGIGTSFVWLAAQAHNQGQSYCYTQC